MLALFNMGTRLEKNVVSGGGEWPLNDSFLDRCSLSYVYSLPFVEDFPKWPLFK
jgi:hypothetical protein